MITKTFTPWPLANSVEELEAARKAHPRQGPLGGMVVKVEGRDAVQIPLNRNKFMLIDVEDYPFVGQFRWTAQEIKPGKFYAGRLILRHRIYIHHALLPPIDGLFVDHRNRDTLDNRRSNLRYATRSQNRINCGMSPLNKSGYTGVFWESARRKWVAAIKRRTIGRFNTKEEAAMAYDEEARRIDPHFYRLNFPIILSP